MPALTPDLWRTMRAEYEAGVTTTELAAKYKVSRVAIHSRRTKEKWSIQKPEALIARTQALDLGLDKRTVADAAAIDQALWDAAERRDKANRRHMNAASAIAGLQARLLLVVDTATKNSKAISMDRAGELMRTLNTAAQCAFTLQTIDRRALGLKGEDATVEVKMKEAAAGPGTLTLPPEMIAAAAAILEQTKGRAMDPAPAAPVNGNGKHNGHD